MKNKLLRRILGALACLFALGLLCFGLIQWRVHALSSPYMVSLESAPKAQAVVILGAKVYANGSPSPALADRLAAGLSLYQQGKAPKILVTGDGRETVQSEVEAMTAYLLERDVPPEDILQDPEGLNTYASLYRAQSVYGLSNILIVTQKYHTGRSVYLGRQLGLNCWALGTPDSVFRNIPYNYARESLARVKAFINAEIQHLQVN